MKKKKKNLPVIFFKLHLFNTKNTAVKKKPWKNIPSWRSRRRSCRWNTPPVEKKSTHSCTPLRQRAAAVAVKFGARIIVRFADQAAFAGGVGCARTNSPPLPPRRNNTHATARTVKGVRWCGMIPNSSQT